MLQDGANFIDIGGQSSKPKAAIVSIDEELKRVVSIVDLILKKFPETMISIDTFNSKVAQIAVENGAAIINDISAGNLDDNMFETIAKTTSSVHYDAHARHTANHARNDKL
ncbi:dihydropteroate synthase [Flavobacterium psychrophilum]|nr:dihydropteroate synthase [Flavobacterium psychrophilum]